MFFSNSWLKATHELKKIGLMIVALLSVHLFGQQSYFNVPFSDKTDEGTWFIQQQSNFSSRLAVGHLDVHFRLAQKISRNWILSCGIQMPNPNPLHPNGIVIELTRAL